MSDQINLLNDSRQQYYTFGRGETSNEKIFSVQSDADEIFKSTYELKNEFKMEESETTESNTEEKWQTKLLQIVIPFFIAGFGMVCAGLLLDYVHEWKVFKKVAEMIVLVPALLDLKGNLDMSLASRLSTQVNLGEVHDRSTIILAIIGNAALKLLQSIVVGCLASFVACLTEYMLKKTFTPENLLTLVASSVTSAALTSVVFGLIVMSIILISKKYKINPDNVATPIAGTIGDVGALITLACVGTFFYSYKNQYWIHITLFLFFIILIPFLICYTKTNPFVKSTLYHGWVPIITSMLISSISGIVLEIAIKNYEGIEAYQPVMNGVGGNLVSIYSSRLSTEISRDPSTCGSWAKWAPVRLITYPYHAFFGKLNPEAKTSRLLMCLVIPGHIIFFFIIYFLTDADTRPALTIWLVLFYLAAAVIQVTLLFIMCYYMVHIVWRLKRNPDDYCISLLTSFGDIFGVCLLYFCFHSIYLLGDTSVKATKSTTLSFLNLTNTTVLPKPM